MKAIDIGWVTLVGFIKSEYPQKYGNSFSIVSNNGKEYRVVNMVYENLDYLLEEKKLVFPIEVELIEGTTSVNIIDKRIPDGYKNV